MSDDAPVDLRSLADVESPDVVRGALRDFRRRVVRRYVWVAIVVSGLIVAAFLYPPERSLVDRIEDAPHALVGYSVQTGTSTWTLLRVADLGDSIGLEWLEFHPRGAGAGRLSFSGTAGAAQSTHGLGTLLPFELGKPAGGVVVATVREPGEVPFELPLDLTELGVPRTIWGRE